VVFVQRHAANPDLVYSPPHYINKKANIAALNQLGIKRVLAFGSVGSMRSDLRCGTLVVPDDFVSLEPITFFNDHKGHMVPKFDKSIRDQIIQTLDSNGFKFVDKGAYYQSWGPRFETAAEIRLFATQCSVVGMTNAHEAILCQELGMSYATLCMIDNMANGIVSEVDMKEFHDGVARNLSTMESVLGHMLKSFAPTSAADKVLDLSTTYAVSFPSTFSSASSVSNTNTARSVDLVVNAKHIVPVVPDNVVLDSHSIISHNGVIIDILPSKDASLKYIGRETVNLPNHAVMPGFVNAHTHCGMSLLRGFGAENQVIDWLMQDIWPAEGEFVSPDFVRTGTELAMAEMIRGGTTCFNDMYFHPEVAADACAKSGMRATIGAVALDFPNPYAKNFDDYISKGEQVLQKYAQHDRIRCSVAPHAPYTVCDDHFTKCKTLAEKYKLPIHIHLHETENEVKNSSSLTPSAVTHRSEQKTSPLVNLHRLGLVNKDLIAVHMTCLSDQDIKLLAQNGSNVVHCPFSNLKLASGFTRVHDLLQAGVNVCLGTDSTASNNSLDMLQEVKLAACLAKAVASNPTAVPANVALQMATLNGAKAIGLDKSIGSLEVGKFSDFIAIKLDDVETMPTFNVITHIVYSADRDKVTDAWVAGKRLMNDRTLCSMDIEQVKQAVLQWQPKLQAFAKKDKSK
jgi:5-methylthioadenosine/S-adenosylhomocysteine deaminase